MRSAQTSSFLTVAHQSLIKVKEIRIQLLLRLNVSQELEEEVERSHEQDLKYENILLKLKVIKLVFVNEICSWSLTLTVFFFY